MVYLYQLSKISQIRQYKIPLHTMQLESSKILSNLLFQHTPQCLLTSNVVCIQSQRELDINTRHTTIIHNLVNSALKKTVQLNSSNKEVVCM